MLRAGHHNGARLALLALVVSNVALALGPWLVRIARAESAVGPVGSAFWRLGLALPVLVLAAGREPQAPQANSRRLALIALLSGLFFAADLGTWHFGILHTRLANATLLGNVTALLFPLYGFILARALPIRRQGFALILAMVGAGMLLGRSYELSARNLMGDLMCVVAGFCYTGYLIAIDRVRLGMGPLRTLAWSVAAGAPALLLVAMVLDDPVWPRIWWPLILLALGSQIIGQGLVLYAVSRVTPLIVGLMVLIQPVIASAIGWLFFNERLTMLDLLGAVAIGGSVLLVRDAGRPLPTGQMSLNT